MSQIVEHYSVIPVTKGINQLLDGCPIPDYRTVPAGLPLKSSNTDDVHFPHIGSPYSPTSFPTHWETLFSHIISHTLGDLILLNLGLREYDSFRCVPFCILGLNKGYVSMSLSNDL